MHFVGRKRGKPRGFGRTSKTLAWVEARSGVALADPVLQELTPHDLTWLTFTVIYAALGICGRKTSGVTP